MAKLEGTVDGVKHSQSVVLNGQRLVLGVIAIGLSLIVFGFGILYQGQGSVETKLNSRMDRIENVVNGLPDRLLAIAIAISGRRQASETPAPADQPPKAPAN